MGVIDNSAAKGSSAASSDEQVAAAAEILSRLALRTFSAGDLLNGELVSRIMPLSPGAGQRVRMERARRQNRVSGGYLVQQAVVRFIADHGDSIPVTAPPKRGSAASPKEDLERFRVTAPRGWWRLLATFAALTGRSQQAVVAQAVAVEAMRAAR